MPEPLVSRLERELFFRNFAPGLVPDDELVSRFVDLLREELRAPGELVFRRGDPADFTYYVVRGRVELREKGESPFLFADRSAIGGLDALQGKPYGRDAVCLEETLLLRIRMDDYLDLLEDHFDFARGLLGRLAFSLESLAVGRPDEVYPQRGQEQPLVSPEQPLGLVERLLVLHSAWVFSELRLQTLVRLTHLTQERVLAPGEALELEETVWTVVSGAVRLEREAPPLVASLGAGAVLVPFAVLSGQRGYEARGTAPARLLGLRRSDLIDVMEDHPDLMRRMLAHVAGERTRLMRLAANRTTGDLRPEALPAPPNLLAPG